jgi:hypothetical protein
MTHSLHREGTRENLSNDFVMLTTVAVGYNEENAKEKLQKHFRIVAKYDPVNMGSHGTGHLYSCKDACAEMVINNVKGRSHTHNAVFTDWQTVGKVLKELKDAELGLSVIISGVYDDIKKACEYAGLKPHTVNFSLGVYGNTAKLAKPKVREITTMCGHGMISAKLVEKMVADIQKGRITTRRAAEKLCHPCYCALFNVDRAEKLLEEMATNGY